MSGIIDVALGGVIGDVIAKKLTPQFIELQETIKKTFVKSSPSKLLKVRMIKITSTDSTFNSTPTFSLYNPVDDDSVITALSVIPDVDFKTLGRLQMSVNDVEFFQDNAFGDWDIGGISLDLKPEGKLFSKSQKLNFHLYGTGSVTVLLQIERKRFE